MNYKRKKPRRRDNKYHFGQHHQIAAMKTRAARDIQSLGLVDPAAAAALIMSLHGQVIC